MVIRSLGWFFVVFFVPALAIRYGLIFGLPALAAVAGVVLVVVTLVVGIGCAPGRALLGELTVALLGGVALAGLAYSLVSGYPEARCGGLAGDEATEKCIATSFPLRSRGARRHRSGGSEHRCFGVGAEHIT